jgi:aminoglycoside phosphotransferase (APT) family kinase protein
MTGRLGPDPARLAAVLREMATVAAARSVVPLGSGEDHDAFLVDGNLVVRLQKDPATAARTVEREAELLELVARVATVPVPVPAFVLPEHGCLGYRQLPGEPLLQTPPVRRSSVAEQVGAVLGELLAALHGIPAGRVGHLVEVEPGAPTEELAEAVRTYEQVHAVMPEEVRPHIERFLGMPPPSPADGLVFSHNDLGIEHVLVDPDDLSVTGVIDWSDAAVTDPASDFGLILRDLGPTGLERALATYGTAGGDQGSVSPERVWFRARCAALEDLAYGLGQGRSEYADKTLAALPWLFGDATPLVP